MADETMSDVQGAGGEVPFACGECGKVMKVREEVSDPPYFCSKICTQRYMAMNFSYLLPEVVGGKGVPYALPQIPPPEEPGAALLELNDKHFVTTEGGKTVVVTEGWCPIFKRPELKRSSFNDFRNLYINRKVVIDTTSGKSMRLATHWLEHPEHRAYEGIVFAPGKHMPGYYNLWRGFGVTPKRGDWSLMESHILDNICNGDEELYRYVLGWMAFAVQHPDRPGEVALVMRGRQGTGKGVFAREFGKLFGSHYLHLSQAQQLVGRFNGHLEAAVMVFADEAFLATDAESLGRLKAVITEPEITIERKFQDAVQMKNAVHLIIASNHDWVVPASAEERRFCLLDVSSNHMQDQAYFRAVTEQMDNGGRASMLYDLLHANLSNFNVRQAPQTGALRDQKRHSLDAFSKWWLDKLEDGQLLPNDDTWTTQVAREELLNDYRNATGSTAASTQDLRNRLAKVLPDGYPEDGKRVTKTGKRPRTWEMPSLAECRERFERITRISGSWTTEEE